MNDVSCQCVSPNIYPLIQGECVFGEHFYVPGIVTLLIKSHPNQIRSVVERVTLLALVGMLFYTADMTCFDIDEFLAVVLLPRLTFLYVEDYCIHSTLLDRTKGIFFEHNRVLQTMLPLVLDNFMPSFRTIISLQGQDYRIFTLL